MLVSFFIKSETFRSNGVAMLSLEQRIDVVCSRAQEVLVHEFTQNCGLTINGLAQSVKRRS